MSLPLQSPARRFLKTAALTLIWALQTGCVLTGLEYEHGIERYETIKNVKSVWASKADGSLAIELETVQYTREESKLLAPKSKNDPPVAARLGDRPSRRRWIAIDAMQMEKLVQEARRRYRSDHPPRGQLEIDVSPHYDWIQPKEFDGPDLSGPPLSMPLAAGYSIYAWQEPVQLQVPGEALGTSYSAWRDPIPWTSRDGKLWMLSLKLPANSGPLRHDRPLHAYDASIPVLAAADAVLLPAEAAVWGVVMVWSFVIIAIWGI